MCKFRIGMLSLHHNELHYCKRNQEELNVESELLYKHYWCKHKKLPVIKVTHWPFKILVPEGQTQRLLIQLEPPVH